VSILKKVKVGIIGCGGIANHKHLPHLTKFNEVEVVAFCDIRKEKAVKAAKKYGAPGAKVFSDYKDLLAMDEVNVVHICTPNKPHSYISVDALNAGKHVMCEKPMASDAAGARAMFEAYKRSGRKLTIAYPYRFTAQNLYLKNVCERGDLGEIYFAKARAVRRRGVPASPGKVFIEKEMQGGGPLIDIGTHVIDLVLWLMNNYEVESVMGSTYCKFGKKKIFNPSGFWDPEKFTVEDSAFGFVKFKNGATLIVESSWILNTLFDGKPTFVLCGTEGGADDGDGLRINGEKYMNLYSENVEVAPMGIELYREAFRGTKPRFHVDPGRKIEHYVLMRHWIDCIVKDKEPLVKPEEALVVAEIIDAVYESSKTGRTVYFN